MPAPMNHSDRSRPLAPPPWSKSAPSTDAHSGPRPCIDSQALLGAHEEIEIRHRGQAYRLRRTASGKLILTK